MTLAEHIQAEGGKPFRLGEADCAHFVAAWVLSRTGRDALAVFQGLPKEVASALLDRRLLRAAFATGCRSVGLPRTFIPDLGDVGIVRCGSSLRCAIRGRNAWIFRDERGLSIVAEPHAHALASWTVS